MSTQDARYAGHARPPLATVLVTVGQSALVAAGIVIFVPTAVFLTFGATTGLIDWVAWLIPLLVWVTGLLPALRQQRAIIQTAAGFLLVLMVFVVPDAGSWISVTTVCFASIVGAVFNLSTRAATAVVLIATVLDGSAALLIGSSGGLFGVMQFAPWTGALLQILAGGGLVIAWQSWMRIVTLADQEFEAIRRSIESDQQAFAAQEGAEAVARRIHETFLNTLTAISMGIDESEREEAISSSQRDLTQMERSLQQLPDSSVKEIISTALLNLQPTALACTLTLTGDRIIQSRIANPLHDAVLEALRNVERHSGKLSADITVNVTNELITLMVSDHGVGPADFSEERFGLRNAIRANMRSINGTALLQRNPQGGTTVIVTAPVQLDRGVDIPTFPILGATDASTIGRLGAAGTNLFMLAILVPVISELPNPGILAAANLAYIASILALALAWTTKARPWLNWLAIALLAGPLIAASANPLTCAATPAIQTLITGASGGALLLLLIANNSLYPRILIFVLATTGLAAVTVRMPVDCRVESVLTAGIQVVYLGVLIIVMTWIGIRFEAQRTASLLAWTSFVQEQARLEHQAAIARGWSNVGTSARELLEGIAGRTLQPDDREVRARATAESAAIRVALGLGPEVDGAFGVLANRLSRASVKVGAIIDAETVTALVRQDQLPEEIIRYLESLVFDAGNQTITLRSFVDAEYDEIVVAIPQSVKIRPVVQFVEDVVLQTEANLDATIITIRRPTHRAG
jgi:signal transduction histidine kinase